MKSGITIVKMLRADITNFSSKKTLIDKINFVIFEGFKIPSNCTYGYGTQFIDYKHDYKTFSNLKNRISEQSSVKINPVYQGFTSL